MVTHTRTPPRTRALRQLNAPQPVSVRADASGQPLAVLVAPITKAVEQRPRSNASRATRQARLKPLRSDGLWLSVTETRDTWKINDEWWRGPDHEVERIYFDLTLDNGQHITVFHDLRSSSWHRQSG